MANAPDTSLMTGPNFAQVAIGNALITVTGQTAQATLTALLAPIGGGTGIPKLSVQGALTAFAGGGQTNGTLVNTSIAQFSTVATIGDSGKLIAATPGLAITIANIAANSMNVFPNTGDQINALGANTAFALAGGKTADFYCATAGRWHAILSA